MLFNRKGKFFLNLDGNADQTNSDSPEAAQQDSDQISEQTTATETAVAEKPMTATAIAEAPIASSASSEQQDSSHDPVVAESVKPVATLESITNDLAIAEAQRQTVNYTTFAPDNLLPGSGLRPRTRRPGAALKDFRGIAQDLFKS